MKVRIKRGEQVPPAPTYTLPRNESKTKTQSMIQRKTMVHKPEPPYLTIAFLILIISSLYWAQTNQNTVTQLTYTDQEILHNLTQTHTDLTATDLSIINTENLLVTNALFHVTQFNPAKRMALYRALSSGNNSYESRILKHWQTNISDTTPVTDVRNDLMTSFLSIRPEATPKQETIANLFDSLDDLLRKKTMLLTLTQQLQEQHYTTTTKILASQRIATIAWIIFAMITLLFLFLKR
ncbi:MAG: hypothetical protein AABX52_02945 [Nanoarchaeota archaeon]